MPTPLRLLIVEDSPDDALLVRRELQRAGFQPEAHRVETPEGMSAALDEGGWELIIADYELPRFDGPAALRLLTQRQLDIPLIIVSGAIGEELAVAAMLAGARDYVMKKNLTRLGPVVVRELKEAVLRQERRAAKRSLEQAESSMRQMQKLEAVRQLAAGVAHDFNNVLAVITLHAERLRRLAGETPELRRSVGAIESASRRGVALTRQLLAVGRRQAWRPEVLHLNTLVHQVHELVSRLMPERITVTLRLAPELTPLLGDASQLEQVLINLLINARDAIANQGDIVVETAAVPAVELPPGLAADPSLPHLRLTIADTGCGMDSDIQARIFEPFFSTKEPGKGTGLGLAVSHGVVAQCGGFMTVQSAPEEGAAISVYLPACRQPVAAREPISAPQILRCVGPRDETILLVEDEDDVREAILLALQEQGYRVLQARTAEAALQLLAAHEGPVHLLVADVGLPGESGVALAERALRHHGLGRVLLISGHSDELSGLPAAVVPSARFLRKPFTTERLLRKVRTTLDHSPGYPAENC